MSITLDTYVYFTPEGFLCLVWKQGEDFQTYGDEQMQYLCQLSGITPDQLVKVTDEQLADLRTGDGMERIWDFENKVVIDAPVYAYDKAVELSEAYKRDLQSIKDALLIAILTDDNELMAELKQEYRELIEDYQNESLL